MHIPERIGGMPRAGVILALGAAAIVGYFIFFRRGIGGGNTNLPPGVVAFSGDINPDYSASIGIMNQELLGLGSQMNSLAGQQHIETELWSLPWASAPDGMQNAYQLAPGRWVDLGPAHAPADLVGMVSGNTNITGQ